MASVPVSLKREFAEMNGWEAESDAATLLNGLGIDTEFHYTQMADLTGSHEGQGSSCTGSFRKS